MTTLTKALAVAAPAATTLLPNADLPHNRLASVRAVEAVELSASTIAAVTETVEKVEAVLLAAPVVAKTAVH